MSLISKDFLELNDKPLYFILKDGIWWVAVKPICEALEVNYNRQFQNLQKDQILGAVFANQQIQIPNDQGRKMVCLPERFIYGWLFSIRSESKALLQYKKKCNDILYDYFHGTITRRQNILNDRIANKKEIESLTKSLEAHPD